MIHKIYCIYDNKIASFGVPFFAPLREIAYRHMHRAVQNLSLDVAQFPSDFVLFEMGEYGTPPSALSHQRLQSERVARTVARPEGLGVSE